MPSVTAVAISTVAVARATMVSMATRANAGEMAWIPLGRTKNWTSVEG